jgi:tetratricopeptide (TPR) repeat protein/transcriptional regulator with XRE-family HTH domain
VGPCRLTENLDVFGMGPAMITSKVSAPGRPVVALGGWPRRVVCTSSDRQTDGEHDLGYFGCVMETPVGDPIQGFGAWLRRRRDDIGVTQETLAERAGLAVRTVRYVESGRSQARSDTRRLIEAALNQLAESAHGAVPALLPPDVNAFTARTDEIAELDRILLRPSRWAGGCRIIVLTGTAGVGKTTLAVHWAHRVRDQFPEGQIYLDLRGFSPSGPMVSTADAARRMLYAAGISPLLIPPELDAQIDLFRSEMSRRRMLLILDNARDAEQVRPLLPGGSTVGVIVTSRSTLTGLVTTHGMDHLAVDLLTANDARTLLQYRLGSARVSAEPEAVDRIVRGCARLPLALAIVAGRATVRPRARLAHLAEELGHTRQRLDALSADDPAIDARTVLSWSYEALRPATARLFRLLTLHPGPDIGVSAAACLAGISLAEAAQLLAELSSAHLVSEQHPERYTMHDVLRAYAAERTSADDADAERRDATLRMLDYYLLSAHAADQRMNPALETVGLLPPHADIVAEQPADPPTALAWLNRERAVLISLVHHAAEHGYDAHAWRLGLVMINLLDAQGHWYDEAAMARTAVAATIRIKDNAAEAHARRLRGFALYRLDNAAQAEREFIRALKLYRLAGETAGQAHTHYNIGQLRAGNHRFKSAILHARRAYALYSALHHARGQANALNAWGWFLAHSGRPGPAVAYCTEALALHRGVGNLRGLVNTHDSLGHIHRQLHNHIQAVAHYQHAAALSRRLGDRYYEASVLEYAGVAHLDAGDPQEADRTWRQALVILDEINHAHRERERIRRLLEELSATV